MSKGKKVKEVINNTVQVGNTCAVIFQESLDLGVAKVGLSSYRIAIAAVKEQIKYKKLTGDPERIKFLED
jgi:hypothetical protein